MWETSIVERLSAIAPVVLPVLMDAAIKGAAILILTALAALMMRRASAAARHLVWFLGAISLLIVPILSAMLPHLDLLPRWTASIPAQPAVALVAPSAPSLTAAAPVQQEQLLPDVIPAPAVPAVDASPVASTPSPVASSPLRLTWQTWIMLAWLAGVAATLGYITLGILSLFWLGHRSRRVTNGDCLTLLHQLRAELGLRRPVELLTSRQRSMPMTWGLWRTRLLLPEESATWPAGQLRAVLLHELAHVRRWDCLTQLIVQVACALYWFNPLVWLAWRRMQTERERACDDLVLNAGAKASAYAEQILHIASDMPAIPLTAAAIAMARPGKLEGRLLAILDVRRNRRAVGGIGILAGIVVLLGVALPVAMLRGAQETSSTSGAIAPPGATEKQLQEWVEDFFRHNYRDITDRKTLEWGKPETNPSGNLSIRYKFQAVLWEKDIMIGNQVFTFTPAGTFVAATNVAGFPLKQGTVPPTTRPAVADDKIDEALHQWVEKFFQQNYHDITARKSLQWGQPQKLPDGNWQIRYKYDATIGDADHITSDKLFAFTSTGEFVNVKDAESPTTQPAAARPPSRLQVRPVLNASEKGAFDEMADPDDPKQTLRIGREVVVDDSAVAGASVGIIGGDERLMLLTLNPAGERAFMDAISLGRLAILLDGRVVSARQQALDGTLKFPAGQDRQATRALVDYFNRRNQTAAPRIGDSARPAAFASTTRPSAGIAPTTRPLSGRFPRMTPPTLGEGPTCALDGTIYELRLPPDQIGRIDLPALAKAAATPAAFEKALADLGLAKPLYRANQAVRISGDSITIGAQTPIVSNTRMAADGQPINTYTYVSTGAIFRVAGQDRGAGRVELDLSIQVSDVGDAAAAGALRPPVRMATLAHKGPVTANQPFVVASVDAASPDSAGKAVAYIARITLGEPQSTTTPAGAASKK